MHPKRITQKAKTTTSIVFAFWVLVLLPWAGKPLLAITLGTTGGSATGTAGRGAASNLQNAGAASAAMTAALARKSIERSDTAVGAMRAMQQNAAAAAKAAARSGTPLLPNGQPIPNGLAVNWLHPHDGFDGAGKPLTTSWKGASINADKTGLQSSGDHNVEITQTEQNAYLYWKNFNVGPRTTVNFDQSRGGADAGKWIAFNKITGTASPSSIYGRITSGGRTPGTENMRGQVYILNQDGIMFHNGSEVNVHSLVASTLPINPYFAGDPMKGIEGVGLLNNPGYQFLFSALPSGASRAGSDSFDPLSTTLASRAVTGDRSITVAPASSYRPGDSVTGSGIETGTKVVSVSANNDGSVMINLSKPLSADMSSGSDISGSIAAANVGAVIAERGALIYSPSSSSKIGGRVALVGASVANSGTIATPDGQTILAAGLQVGLAAHPSDDPSLRGLDVYIGRISDSSGGSIDNGPKLGADGLIDFNAPRGNNAGTVFNAGLIEIPRGHTALAGSSITHSGVIDGTTSVSLNGRVDIVSSYNAAVSANSLGSPYYYDHSVSDGTSGSFRMMGTGVIRLLPEWDSLETAPGTSLALPSLISILGNRVSLDAGSVLVAPGAKVGSGTAFLDMTSVARGSAAATIQAGVSILSGNWYRDSSSVDKSQFLSGSYGGGNGGSITLGEGSVIDVSGSTSVRVESSKNFITLQLRGPELANSPLQRESIVRAKNITVDARISGVYDGQYWIGTPLGDATGYASLIQRTVGELTVEGGNISLGSGDRLSLARDSLLNVSGGWIQYSGGEFTTTKLLTSQGTVVDISKATPDRFYAGFVQNPKPVRESPYISGGAGGSVLLRSPSMELAGTMTGLVVSGARQTRSTPETSALPGQSSLTLRVFSLRPDGGFESPQPQQLVFSKDPGAASDNGRIILSTSYFSKGGIGSLNIDNHDGSILLPVGTDLSMAPGGRFELSAGNIDIFGRVSVPGGTISLSANSFGYDEIRSYEDAGSFPSLGNASRGGVLIGPSAVLSTAGIPSSNWGDPYSSPVASDGGRVSVEGFRVSLDEGSLVDVSGAYLLTTAGQVVYGDAGKIKISGGVDAQYGTLGGGVLNLNSTLQGYAGLNANAGSLSLTAPSIRIGNEGYVAGILGLRPEFFNNGGFAEFSLSGIGVAVAEGSSDDEMPGMLVTAGTMIHPAVINRILKPNGDYSMVLLPEGMRPAVSVSLGALGISSGGLISVRGRTLIQSGASIRLDPQLSLTEMGSVTPLVKTSRLAVTGKITSVDGMLDVPGGSITLSAASSYPDNYDPVRGAPFAKPTLELGATARVSAAGATFSIGDPGMIGRAVASVASVLRGGEVSMTGNIRLSQGSVVDVSGSSGSVSVRSGGAFPYQTRNIASDGGAITLLGNQYLVAKGDLLALAGGSSASGGQLTVSSGTFYPLDFASPPSVIFGTSLFISQNQEGLAGVMASDLTGRISRGYLSADIVDRGQFDRLVLSGNLGFLGPVSLAADKSISVASGGVISGDAAVQLLSPYVSVGNFFEAPLAPGDGRSRLALGGYDSPSGGTGSLVIRARVADLGNTLVKGMGSVTVDAGPGEIRGNGTFSMAGQLKLIAGMIYPMTKASFNLVSYDRGETKGSVLVEQAGVPGSLPLTAGGNISVYAHSISQGGTMVAPFGMIKLGWDGSGSSPEDPLTGAGIVRLYDTDPIPVETTVPVSSVVRLEDGGTTSVSGIDVVTGRGVTMPYGVILNGSQWIDPAGNDISVSGLPARGVTLSAGQVITGTTSRVLLSGGGDLMAYDWIGGLRGTIDPAGQSRGDWSSSTAYFKGDRVVFDGDIYSARQDNSGETPAVGSYWSRVRESYAVIPGFNPLAQPFAPFGDVNKTAGDPGYVSRSLGVGDRITLAAGGGLAAGIYTLLPSRYAIMPGAYLITPMGLMQDLAPDSLQRPDGSAMVAGSRSSSLDGKGEQLSSLYEVASPSLVSRRAEYQISLASTFLPRTSDTAPVEDAARLIIRATDSMNLRGKVEGAGSNGGRGAMIDLASTANFRIGRTPDPAAILLDHSVLSSWNAGSLLIGGVRQVTGSGFSVAPMTSLVTVENSVSPLAASDLILASGGGVVLEDGSAIESRGTMKAEDLEVSGNGALIRVSSDPLAIVTRSGTGTAPVRGYDLGEQVSVSGGSVTLDSSGGGDVAESVRFDAQGLNLNAGKIVLSFGDASKAADTMQIGGDFLRTLTRVASISLNGRDGIFFKGSGTIGSSSLRSLALHTSMLRGDDVSSVTIDSGSVLMDNPYTASGSLAANGGSLIINTGTLIRGRGEIKLSGFQNVTLNAFAGIVGRGTGALSVAGSLFLNAPSLTGEGASSSVFSAQGNLTTSLLGTMPTILDPGLGASLTLRGNAVALNAPVLLPGGSFVAESTGSDRDLVISSRVDVGGTVQRFDDLAKYVDAGNITLSSGRDVRLGDGAILRLDALANGGSAGTLAVNAVNGTLDIGLGVISAHSGSSGLSGNLVLDLGTYGTGDLSELESLLTQSGFTESQGIRIRNGDVTLAGAKAHSYSLSADSGSITVTGSIDASGVTGGNISLYAGKSVLFKSGATLDASGDEFDSAGKGGYVTLEAGNNPSLGSAGVAAMGVSGSFASDAWVIDLGGGVIDLSVDEVSGLGQSSGRLHLRAPQTADNKDVQVNPIATTIEGASAIVVEGVFRQDAATTGTASIDTQAAVWDSTTSYTTGTKVLYNGQLYTAKRTGRNFTPPNGTYWTATPDTSFKQKALDNATSFMAYADAVRSRILPADPSSKAALAGILEINPGEEIVNSRGSLVLNNDWDLSLARYGRQVSILDASGNVTGRTIGRSSGFLSLRALGDLTFNGSLSDGFGDSVNRAANAGGNNYGLYFAPLLPVVSSDLGDPSKTFGQSSWSYSIAAGKDFSSADPLAVSSEGSINLGKPTKTSSALASSVGQNASTATIISGNYQVIRTGTGDISIAAGKDIRLLNQFATIYTAGAQVADPTLGGAFDPHTMPVIFRNSQRVNFGTLQQPALYPAQYSVRGGDVQLRAAGNIRHLQLSSDGLSYIADSSRQLPGNWLMRRGQTDATGGWLTLPNGEITSTSWWIDFSNFFQNVGALGGGNVSMRAGGDISNVDAVVPTQGRLTARDPAGIQLVPQQGSLIETGGGDVTVQAGGNIDAGIYYVERGNASIRAGGAIVSNKTRDVAGAYLYSLVSRRSEYANPSEETWLPTSFLLGRGAISVKAGGDMLLGPVGNVFLLPQGFINGVQYKNYFSTYGSESAFSAISLGGSVTLRNQILGLPAFQKWLQSSVMGNQAPPQSAGYYQPWLRLAELQPADPILGAGARLMPGNVSLTALAGSVLIQGDATLAPSARGNLSIYAMDGINGLNRQQKGVRWSYSTLNVSDADPRTIPSPLSPLSQSQLNFWPALDTTYLNANSSYSTLPFYLENFSTSLNETLSTEGDDASLQGKVLRHDQSLLHLGDSDPVRVYSPGGDISGIRLFSPKLARIVATGNIRDVSLALQHVSSSDVSSVISGGGMTLFDANTASRNEARKDLGANVAFLPEPLSGDVQISGPGTLQVFAGENLDLGTGDARPDGSGAGITSIGNARNPSLPFEGASLIVGAGLASARQLGLGASDTEGLLRRAAGMDSAQAYFAELMRVVSAQGDKSLSEELDRAGSIAGIITSPIEEDAKSRIALSLFYVILRDSGRNHGDPRSKDFGTYRQGRVAIESLFPGVASGGGVILNSRNIRTKSGGDISVLAPRGGVALAEYSVGSSLAPPGIVSEGGGSVNMFSRDSVTLGIGRIFTLRGGDIMIWSDKGDIAAGSSSKTIKSAPPTRVLLDPQSAAVRTDLAGLATGGGIGVLAAVAGIPPGNVDLIAPSGFIDAGDAGIRSTGNLNLSAREIRNADNILVGGVTVGAPPVAPSAGPITAPPPAAPPAGATAATAAANSASANTARNTSPAQADPPPSVFSIDILGYGGDEEEEERKSANASQPPVQASL